MANPADKRTASQRIEDLERAVMSIYQVTNNMARDNSLIKNAIKLLDSKVASMMKASVAGEPLTEEVISKYMKQAELEELENKVKNLIAQGFLVPAESVEDGTFVVGSEDEPAAADGTPGKSVHSRLQFTLNSLDKEVQEKLKGAKAGDVVVFKGDALVFKVKEIYKIVNPTPAPAAPEAPKTEVTSFETPAAPSAEAAPVAAAPSAPAEQSSSDAEATQTAPDAAPAGTSAGN